MLQLLAFRTQQVFLKGLNLLLRQLPRLIQADQGDRHCHNDQRNDRQQQHFGLKRSDNTFHKIINAPDELLSVYFG